MTSPGNNPNKGNQKAGKSQATQNKKKNKDGAGSTGQSAKPGAKKR